MKLSDAVSIVCDHRTVESALALRGVLERLGLHVSLHRLVEARDAVVFFRHPVPLPKYTVLVSGATTGEESPGGVIREVFEGGLRFEVTEVEYGDLDVREEVERHETFVDLTSSTIPTLMMSAGGTLIATSGQESLVQPFLAAGHDAVIVPTRQCPDHNTALLFTIDFCYFAMSADAGYDDERAVAQAANVFGVGRGGPCSFEYHKPG